jgi:diguanylate cyclase (GGDEF)-like protein
MTAISMSAARALRWFRIAPAARVALGLSALMVSSLLVLDIVFGLVPDQAAMQQQLRQRTSENLAIQIAALFESGDRRALSNTLTQALARETSMRSVAIRTADGEIALQVGEHMRHWVPPPPGQSTADHVRVPLSVDKRHWGDVELSFDPARPPGIRGLLGQPLVLLIVALGGGSFVMFSLYLRRVLEHLDPSAVIPERVRVAFDAFAEGVMIVDPGGRIVLANTTLRGWMGRGDVSIYGRTVQDIPGLKSALPGDPKEYPWMRAMATRTPLKGEHVELAQDGVEAIKATISCSPVFDGRRSVRGCIVTFDDITELERLNGKLMASIEELNESKVHIERQNEELRRLATRDPLTGCLNRRAFFEQLDTLFVSAQSSSQALCCIMTDIDHFKSFNDRYGHAIGDQVLQVVSRSLFSGLRENDLLCRYGGEEFCIVLPEVDMTQAAAVAERLRTEIEHQAGKGVRSTQGITVTSSFGVAFLAPDIADPAELIDRADKALYAAKHGGRNRVTAWQEGMTQQG